LRFWLQFTSVPRGPGEYACLDLSEAGHLADADPPRTKPRLAAAATGSQNHRNQVTATHLDGQ